MKNIIAITATILLASTIWCHTQVVPVAVGTYPGDPSGEQIGHQLFVKLNYDLDYLYNLATNQAAQIAALQAQGQPASMVQSSTTVSLLNSNPFVFNGTSNYLGPFTNVFSLTCVAGTNALTNMMSADGGATWLAYAQTNPISTVIGTNILTNSWVYSAPYYVTNSTNSAIVYTISQLGTNFTTVTNTVTNMISGPLQLAVLSANVCTGSVVVAALADPSLQSRTYDFAGVTLNLPQVASNTAAIAALQTPVTVNLSPSPALVLGTPWTNTYGGTASLIVDGYISMAVAGSSVLTFTNLTTTESHVFAGSTVSIAGTTYFSQSLPDILATNVVEVIVSNTGTASATLTRTTVRVKP